MTAKLLQACEQTEHYSTVMEVIQDFPCGDHLFDSQDTDEPDFIDKVKRFCNSLRQLTFIELKSLTEADITEVEALLADSMGVSYHWIR